MITATPNFTCIHTNSREKGVKKRGKKRAKAQLSKETIMDDKKLLTMREVCSRLGVSHMTVRREIERRKLSCYRFRRRVMFSETHIEDYLKSVEIRAEAGKAKVN